MSEKIDQCKEEVIRNNSLLNESIFTVINFFIRDISKKAVDINIFNKFFSLRIYGDFNENEEFTAPVLKSLLYLCQEVYYVTVKDNIKTIKIIDFSTYKDGVYNEKLVSTMPVEDKIDNVGFIIYRKNYKEPLEALLNNESKEVFKEYLNKRYNNTFNYLKVRTFNEVLEREEEDGVLLEEDILSDNIKIQLYKMNQNCKTLEIIANGVKVEEKVSSKVINWNKYPFRQKGYSFRKMAVYIFVNEKNINFTDEVFIKNIIELCEERIKAIIENQKSHFANDKVYINLDYDKIKMDKICKLIGCKNSVEAVKAVLDKFCLEE